MSSRQLIHLNLPGHGSYLLTPSQYTPASPNPTLDSHPLTRLMNNLLYAHPLKETQNVKILFIA